MRAQDLSIYRKAVRTKDGRLSPQAGARGLSHVQMPPHLWMPPHLRTPPHLWTPPHLRTPPYSDTSATVHQPTHPPTSPLTPAHAAWTLSPHTTSCGNANC